MDSDQHVGPTSQRQQQQHHPRMQTYQALACDITTTSNLHLVQYSPLYTFASWHAAATYKHSCSRRRTGSMLLRPHPGRLTLLRAQQPPRTRPAIRLPLSHGLHTTTLRQEQRRSRSPSDNLLQIKFATEIPLQFKTICNGLSVTK